MLNRKKICASLIAATMIMGSLGECIPAAGIVVPVFAEETEAVQEEVTVAPDESQEPYILKETSTDGKYEYTEYDEGVTIDKYLGDEENVTIPSEINGKSVTEIGYNAFQYNESIKSVTIPEGVTEIENNAFSGSTLKTVNYPSSIQSVGYSAFNSTSVNKVTFASGTEEIPAYACYNMTSLEEISFPAGVKKIGSYAFYGCTALKSVDLTDIEEIGDSAFYNCEGITEITYPKTLTTIGYSVLKGTGITKVTFEDGIEEIPENVCREMTSLEEISFPAGVKKIGSYAFYGCTALKSVDLTGIEEIGYDAFYGCESLTELTYPKSLTTIGSDAFDGTGVTKVTFESGIEEIPNNICSGLKSLTKVNLPKGVKKIGSYAFSNCEGLTSIDLTGIEEIESYAFYNCTGLTELTYPNTITSIGDSAFYGAGVTKVTFPSGIEEIPANACSGMKDLKQFKIPSGVRKIGSYAFSNCEGLTSIDLTGIEEIGDYAFNYCTNITEFTYPKTLTTIGYGVFSGTGITKVSFASGTTEIMSNMCSGMSNLESVTIPNTVTSIGDSAFSGCSKLTSINLPDSVTEIGSSAFSSCYALAEVEIKKGVTVNGSAFSNCTSIKKIIIGDNAVIKPYAFQGCSALEDVVIGKDVTIEDNAFYGITKSGSLTEDDSITYTYTFEGGQLSIDYKGEGSTVMPDFNVSDNRAPWSGYAKNINSVHIDSNITDIGAYSFVGLKNIKSSALPDGIKTIGEGAFKDCTGLTYVEIPATLTKLGEDAFAGCTAITEFYFCGNAPTIGDGAIPDIASVTVYYPETATGWVKRIKDKFQTLVWNTWDDTVKSKDVVLVLDHSGSMSGTMYYGDDDTDSKSRMDALKDAANAFVDAVAGRAKNTRIAVVQYDDTAELIVDFTTDKDYLMNKINSLYDAGGTEYLVAMDSADEVLSRSKADSKNIIFFSDGEPNDSSSYDGYANIKEKAAELDKKYILYAVGIIENTVSYAAYTDRDEALIAVANGDESHYFRADDIETLIKKFLEIADSIVRKPETEVEIKRNGTRFNAFLDDVIFTADSKEQIELIVTAGTKYGEVASYALLKNGTSIMSNKGGIFRFKPAELFTSSDYVEVALYDKDGNEVDRKQVKIRIIDGKYKITFMMNDGTETVYETQYISSGEKPKKPDPEPERTGFIFDGWYTSTKCSGYTFFDIINSPNWPKLDSDTVLYAKWINATDVDITKDGWGFINNSDSFDSQDYEISYGDYAKLQSNITNSKSDDTKNNAETYKAWVKSLKDSTWKGSCFGMSAAAVLIKTGKIKLQHFSPKYPKPGKAELIKNTSGDADVGNIESMINYYMLEQKVGEIYKKAYDSRGTESENLKYIIEELKENPLAVLVLFFNNNGNVNGGHAVVAYGLTEDGDNYSFKVYDCSVGNGEDQEFTVNVTDNGGTYTKECAEWQAEWDNYGTIDLKTVLTAEDLEEEYLLKEPHIEIYNGNSDKQYHLQTDYSNFTISLSQNGATEKETKIQDGKVSGANDINITCEGNQGDAKNDGKQYNFYLPALNEGQAYVITPGAGDASTIISDEGGLFFDKVTTANNNNVAFYNNGVVESKGSSGKMTIKTSGKYKDANWYFVTVEGESGELAVDPSDGKVSIASPQDATKLNITVESDMNSLTFTEKDVEAGQTVSVKGAVGNKVVYTDGSGKEDIRDFGYALTFDSQQGSPVPPLKNQKAGEVIDPLDVPEDPRKDGFVFTGWFKDAEATVPVDFSTYKMPGEDTILYAGWELDPNFFIRVSFRLKGAKDEYTYIPKETAIDKDDDCPVIVGEDKDWYSDAECETKWDFERTVDRNTILYSAGWQEGRMADVTKVTLNKNELNMKKGDKEKLTAAVEPSDINTVFVWNSSDETVATVDQEGNVEAVEKGDAVITVRAGGCSANCVVKIEDNPEGSKGDASSKPKHTKKENTFVGGQKINVADMYFKGVSGITGYKTDPKKVASVDKKGILKAKKAGTVKIDALSGKGKEATTVSSCTIDVLDKPKLKFGKYSIAADEGKVIDAYECFNTASTKETAADSWESTKTGVAEIDEKTGEITIKGKGSTKIIAYFGEKGKKETLKVKATLKVKK